MATNRKKPVMSLDVSFAKNFHRPVEAISKDAAMALQTQWANAEPQKDYSFAATMVEPWLWIGSVEDAKNKSALASHSITHILNVAAECGASSPFRLRDHQDEDITPCYVPAITFIEDARRGNGVCLLHCRQGVSRSAAVCCAYLMVKRDATFEDVFQFLVSKRASVNPNLGFVMSLVEFQKVSGVLHHALEEKQIQEGTDNDITTADVITPGRRVKA